MNELKQKQQLGGFSHKHNRNDVHQFFFASRKKKEGPSRKKKNKKTWIKINTNEKNKKKTWIKINTNTNTIQQQKQKQNKTTHTHTHTHTTYTHTHTVGADLKKLLNNPLFSDITFIIENKPIYAHKSILFVRSEVLMTFLNSSFKESTQNQITIPEVKYQSFLSLLEFL